MDKALQLLLTHLSIIILAAVQDKLVLIEINYDCTRPNLQGQNDMQRAQHHHYCGCLYGNVLCMVHEVESTLKLMKPGMI